MIQSTRDEFLSVARKWQESSASVVLTFKFGGETSSDPIASAFIARIPVRILGIDPNDRALLCATGTKANISIGLEDAFFCFGTSKDPEIAGIISGNDPESEAISAKLTSGLIVILSSSPSLSE